MRVVKIDTAMINDWETFHDVFKTKLGFPEYYERNMDSWINCMRSIHDPEVGLTSITVTFGEILVLQLQKARTFKKRCPEQYKALVESSSFVNNQKLADGEPAVLALSFC